MSRYWNRRVRSLSPYIPGEQPRDRQFIKLNTNENPYPPSPRVIEAVHRAAGDSLRLYPDPSCKALREAVAERYQVKPEQVFPGNGSDEVLAFTFAAFFEAPGPGSPGDPGSPSHPGTPPVLFPDITYSFYPVYADLWGLFFQTIPLEEDFSLSPEKYLIPSSGVIFPNPNAPTGRALSPELIKPVLDYQGRRHKVVVIDEAYAAFGGPSMVPSVNDYPNLLTVLTLSKSASLAGLRVGFAIGQEELIEGLCRVRDSFNSYTLDRLAQAAAAAALADRAYYDGLTRKIIATRTRVGAELAARGFTVIPSAANFLFIRFPRIPGARALAQLREKGILTRHFNQERIADFLRVSMGTDAEMDRFLSACEEIVKR
ncbi:MAG: histidinol-phosphate transaminase [Treponema sp.]|jgi:histidinol-phosphate aminotransferase|nr:histidinol-phosphate transaminase [Treponema sp.]